MTRRLFRWKKVLGPGLLKGHWSTVEDAALVGAVQTATALSGVSATILRPQAYFL